MKRHTLEQIFNKCSEIYKIPTISEITPEFKNNKIVVDCAFNQFDLDRNEKIKYLKQFVFQTKPNDPTIECLNTSKPIQIRSDAWSVKSPNNLLTATISNWKDKSDDKQFLEIWNADSKMKNINLSKLNKHGKLYDGSLFWSSSSSKFAYIAEKKKTNTDTSFFTSNITNTSPDSKDPCINEDNYKEKYANFYVDEWGEQLVGKSEAVITLYDFKTSEFKVIENLPTDYFPDGLSWYKDDGFVFSATYTKPFRLGSIYCPIRKSELFYYDLKEGKCIQLTDSNESVRSPRFSNDFESLCWLQNNAGGPHHQASKLMIMNWNTKKTNLVVDIIKEQKPGFCGIYADSLLHSCWSLDNKRVLVSINVHHKMAIISCNVETGQVTVLDNGLNNLCYSSCLNFENDWIFGVYQGYNKKPSLIVGKLPESGKEDSIKWNFIDDSQDELENISDVTLLSFNPDHVNQTYPNVTFEATLVKPKSANDVLVIFPHGGPHSAFASEFSYHVALLNSLGYSVLLVNYRGSTGYGKDNLDSLLKNIGDQDVKDVQQAAEFCMKKYNFKKATVYGGSHGGFLTTHLIGQYPDFYSSACCRNPVTDLATMWAITDIPDWVYTEVFGQYSYDPKTIPDAAAYENMVKRSPIRYIDAVKTPVLILIGNVDLRVPPKQGVEYYKALISRNKTSELIVFKEDNHPLAKAQTTADSIVNVILWFEKTIKN